jgi:hypothetical protein
VNLSKDEEIMGPRAEDGFGNLIPLKRTHKSPPRPKAGIQVINTTTGNTWLLFTENTISIKHRHVSLHRQL